MSLLPGWHLWFCCWGTNWKPARLDYVNSPECKMIKKKSLKKTQIPLHLTCYFRTCIFIGGINYTLSLSRYLIIMIFILFLRTLFCQPCQRICSRMLDRQWENNCTGIVSVLIYWSFWNVYVPSGIDLGHKKKSANAWMASTQKVSAQQRCLKRQCAQTIFFNKNFLIRFKVHLTYLGMLYTCKATLL